MKVFLSYASDDRPLAELVAGSISARGHRVFFDKTDLQGGDTYEDQIEAAIGGAAVVVFLITPGSVADGRFTLTELGFAQKRWRSAKGRVLPVMARPTPLSDVPAYLRTVSILEPQGNLPAEVAAAVHRMAWATSRTVRRAAALLLFLTAFSVGVYYLMPPRPAFEITASQPVAHEAGYFGKTNKFSVRYAARNFGSVGDEVTDATFEVLPSDALRVVDPPALEPTIVSPGSSHEGFFKVVVEDPNARYRVCVHARRVRQSCSTWVNWQSPDEFLYADTIPLEPSLVEDATIVGIVEGDFVVGARAPNRLVRFGADGALTAELETEGIPSSLSYGPLGLFVGTTGPNEVLEVDPETLSVRRRLPVKLSPPRNRWDAPISTQPVSLAQDGNSLWILTRGGTSTAGLAWLDIASNTLTTPNYYDDIAFDLSDMRLRNGDNAVWSGRNSTTPASIVKLTPEGATTYGGHDYEIASCASDVLPVGENTLLVPDCNGVVRRVTATDTLDVFERVGSLFDYNPTTSSWERIELKEAAPGKAVGALSVRTSEPYETPEMHEARISTLEWSSGSGLVFSLKDARIIDFAAGPTAMLLILENGRGRRQLVSPGYK